MCLLLHVRGYLFPHCSLNDRDIYIITLFEWLGDMRGIKSFYFYQTGGVAGYYICHCTARLIYLRWFGEMIIIGILLVEIGSLFIGPLFFFWFKDELRIDNRYSTLSYHHIEHQVYTKLYPTNRTKQPTIPTNQLAGRIKTKSIWTSPAWSIFNWIRDTKRYNNNNNHGGNYRNY